jgi:hypothetical protein
MGLTLLALLMTALLLPGIVAAKAFYQAAQTREVEPAVPPLTASTESRRSACSALRSTQRML